MTPDHDRWSAQYVQKSPGHTPRTTLSRSAAVKHSHSRPLQENSENTFELGFKQGIKDQSGSNAKGAHLTAPALDHRATVNANTKRAQNAASRPTPSARSKSHDLTSRNLGANRSLLGNLDVARLNAISNGATYDMLDEDAPLPEHIQHQQAQQRPAMGLRRTTSTRSTAAMSEHDIEETITRAFGSVLDPAHQRQKWSCHLCNKVFLRVSVESSYGEY